MPAKKYKSMTMAPHFIHGGDYNPDQWLKSKDIIWSEDMRLAKLAHINEFSVGIFSWVNLEPEEGVYTFEWLDEVMDMIAGNGMHVILAMPSGAKPAWMSQKYEEIRRVDENRQRDLHGKRHNHCMTSPIYRQKVLEMNTRLAERYKDHPALIAWHISNEYGGQCHCELCQAEFRKWLQARYGSLENLNHAWWTSFWSHRYTDWSQVESPSPRGENSVHGLTVDFKRFTTDRFIDFFNWEIKPMRLLTPDIPVTTNLMGMYEGIDYFRLGEQLDFISWDNYPQWRNDGGDLEVARGAAFCHDLMRGCGDQKPFMLMESSPSPTNWQSSARLRRPGVHKLLSLQAVAHGSDSVQYFQYRKSRGSYEKFHGAVIDHEGSGNTRIFREIADLGEVLQKLEPVLGCGIDAKAAVIFDWENRWALSEAKGFLQDKTGYEETVLAHYGALREMGIPVDILSQDKDLSGYRLVVAPMCYMLKNGFADKVRAYVRHGGQFVATYISGYVDDSDLCFLGGFPGPLRDVMGIWNEEIDALYPGQKNAVLWNNRAYEVHDFCEIIHTEGAEALGFYRDDFYAGSPALTVNSFGDGKAYYIAARTENKMLHDFYTRVTASCGIEPVLQGELPQGCEVVCRTDGKDRFVFLMNFLGNDARVDVGQGGVSLLTGAKLSGEVLLKPYGVEVYKA